MFLRILLLLSLTAAGFVPHAYAKQREETLYTYAQVWSTAVRLVRVDLGYQILENDEKAGYILFEAGENEQNKAPGSLELLTTQSQEKTSQTKIIIFSSIPKRPAYIERMVLDKLMRKLREENGDPPKQSDPPATPPPPPPVEEKKPKKQS